MALNKVCYQGNMVRDPQIADTRGQTTVVNFTVANSRKYKDKTDTAYIDCTAFGNSADTIVQYFAKGDPIIVEGRLAQNNWEDAEGNKRSKIYIIVEGFHFAGQTGGSDEQEQQAPPQRGRGGNQRGNQQRGRGPARGRSQQSAPQAPDDDIPF